MPIMFTLSICKETIGSKRRKSGNISTREQGTAKNDPVKTAARNPGPKQTREGYPARQGEIRDPRLGEINLQKRCIIVL